MAGSTINWDETKPGDSDIESAYPAAMRSFQSSVRIGLNAEHDWPSSTGTAGGHKAGSARVFTGTASQVSSADTAGRLMAETNAQRLYYVGSEATWLIGGRNAALGVNTLNAGQKWIMSALTISVTTWLLPVDYSAANFIAPPALVGSYGTTGGANPGVSVSFKNVGNSVASAVLWLTDTNGPGILPPSYTPAICSVIAMGVTST